jgi:hypothetical protein
MFRPWTGAYAPRRLLSLHAFTVIPSELRRIAIRSNGGSDVGGSNNRVAIHRAPQNGGNRARPPRHEAFALR